MIDRAQTIDLQGIAVRADQDIVRLLGVGPRDQLISEVNEKIGDLPADARDLWQRLLTASSS